MARIALKVQKLREAMEHLKRPEVELGRGDYRNPDRSPCCALGHLAAFADPEGFGKGQSSKTIVAREYGFDGYTASEVVLANDGAFTLSRKKQVIEKIEWLIEHFALETAPPPVSQE